MLSLGEGATSVGRSAAFWWHLTDVEPAEIEIAVAHRRRVRARPGVRLLHRGVPPGSGSSSTDQALQAGVDLDALRREHLRNAGRHGATLA